MFLLSVMRFDPSRCDLSIVCDDQRGRPLPLYETQNNECDPILHAAHAAPKTQDTKRKAQKHRFTKENFSRKSYKTQLQEAEACALGLTDNFLQRYK